MFTGIIAAIGTVSRLQGKGGDARISINTGKLDLGDTVPGDSIAVNGVCLTAVSLGKNNFEADVSAESLSRTSLGQLTAGSQVNLELAMRADTRFGGHIVSGHSR
jgi:riboflavin synthase